MEFFFKNLINLNRSYKISILLFTDIILSITSIWITFNLISEKVVKFFEIENEIYFLFSFTYIFIQIIFKSYLKLSRYFDLTSIFVLIKNFIIFFIVLLFYKLILFKGSLIPSANLIIYLIIFFLLVLLKNSLLYNLYNYLFDKNDVKQKRVVLYGFDQNTQNYLKNSSNYNFSIVGIFDESLKFYNTTNNKFKKINFNRFHYIYKKNKITDILVSDKSNYKNKIKYFKKFLKFNVRVVFLSDVNYYLNLNNKLINFKPNFDELIENKIVENEGEELNSNNIKNKTILVLGGAGSIGSVLVKRLLNYKPNKIVIVDKDEYSIFNLKKKLSHKKNIYFKLIDTTNSFFLNKVFEDFKPEYVFNAAAYKHVNIVEENLDYSLFNNIKSAINICELSIKHKVKKCLLVSTDKAVNPSNTMGLSKRICEKIYLENSKKNKSTFLIVRFGNVVGSKGSVVPFFQDMIEKRLPLPVTSKKVTRYLMSINEACDLILKISIFGKNSGIYLLDMGEPINIYDLTYKLIKFNGLSIKNKKNPYGDIEIQYTGLKKGEKLHEKLSYNLKLEKTKFKKIMICNEMYKEKLNLLKIKNIFENVYKTNNFKNLEEQLKIIAK